MLKFRIKELCKAAGITQKTLAERLGTSEAVISQISKGTYNPSLSTLERIATVLDVEVSDLVSSATPKIFGVVESQGTFYKLTNAKDYVATENSVEGVVNTPYYPHQAAAEEAIEAFLKKSVKIEENSCMIGRIGAKVIFTLSVTTDYQVEGNHKVIIAVVNSSRYGTEVFTFSTHENEGDYEYMYIDIKGCITKSFQDEQYGEVITEMASTH